MKINYKQFTKHAEKVAKAVSEQRPILKGIHHDDKGTITVTDSHRLYQAKNVNAPKNAVLCAISGDELDGTYPNTDRLIPNIDDADSVLVIDDVKQTLAVLKAMLAAGRAGGGKKDEV